MSDDIAWGNALLAMPDGPFVRDLARAVTNSGDLDTGNTWLLNFTSRFLQGQGQKSGVWDAFDFVIYDIEALDQVWPVVRLAIDQYRDAGVVGDDPGPALARFLVERLPSIWTSETWVHRYHPPLTRCLVIADRADTLVGMFLAGNAPNGSKDPFALRRAARHLLMQIVFPITVGTPRSRCA